MSSTVLDCDLVLKSNAAWRGNGAVIDQELATYKWCVEPSKTCQYLGVISARRLIGASGSLQLRASDRES